MGQQVLNGIFLGSIYALFAVGYTLVFGVLDILNLAHQAVFMLAAFIALALVARARRASSASTSIAPSPWPSSSPRRWAARPACSSGWPSTPSRPTWAAAWS